MGEERYIERLGSKIHYWMEGPEKGTKIVLSHGATLDHHSFDQQIQALLDNGFQVITWDMRGHGKSEPIGKDLTIEILADDLKAVIEAIGIKKAVFVGHSLGGYVVQKFIHKNPEMAEKAVIIACTDIAKKPNFFFEALYKLMPGLLKRMSLDSFRERTLKELSISQDVKSYASKAMEHITKEDFIKIIASGVEAMWSDLGVSEAYRIPIPFLLTHGENDLANGKVFHKQSPRWAAKEPNCYYEIIPNAGHTAHMDNPEAFDKLLIDFLFKIQ